MERIGSFSKAFKQARLEAGVNQSEIAAALGVEQATISRWERGAEPTIENLALMTKYFSEVGVEFDYMKGILSDMAAAEVRKLSDFVPFVGELGDNGVVSAVEDDSTMDIAAPYRATPNTRAVLVKTTEYHPVFNINSVAYFEFYEAGYVEKPGALSFAVAEDGKMFIGNFIPQAGKNRFTMITPRGTTTGINLRAAAPIKAIIIR